MIVFIINTPLWISVSSLLSTAIERIRINQLPVSATRGLISSTFLAKSEWWKVQSWQQIAEKLELCVQKLELFAQKIFEAFFGIWQPAKSSFFVIGTKKPHVNMSMKLTPGGSMCPCYVLQLLFGDKSQNWQWLNNLRS